MLGDSITLTINAVPKALVKINQDSYGTEYFLKETLGEYRLKIRHQKDNVAKGSSPRDRHTITLVETIFAAGDAPEFIRQSSVSLVGNYSDASAVQADNQVGLQAYLTKAILERIIKWES